MTEKKVYEISGLSKEYQNKEVLNVKKISFYEGEIFAMVGPSGAGKSTFLRLLDFLEPPTAGIIKFMQKKYHKDHLPDLQVKRMVTTVFQRSALLSTTVWKNILYPLKLRNIKIDDSVKNRANKLLAELGLNDFKSQRADKLSGGEAQRTALARALIFEPEVLLLDEPTSNLDPTNISIIEEKIKKYIEKKNKMVVMVTHNIFQAQRLADRVGLLHQGNFVEVNTKEKFFNSPEKELTKRFLSGDLVH